MSRREHAFERLQAADPYPPTVDVTARESAPPLLEATIERRENMQTQEVEPTTATAPRRRRAALGLAVVLVVAAVGAGLWVTSHGDEPFDTAAADDVDVVTEFFDRLDAGDPPGALALVSDSPAIK
ncbi:MAG TPA: hypothetical protein VK960_10045, partial [Acidimicrobiia bacterium]|nr:hypothetical protein [Acidimicrobiia bacterium]